MREVYLNPYLEIFFLLIKIPLKPEFELSLDKEKFRLKFLSMFKDVGRNKSIN